MEPLLVARGDDTNVPNPLNVGFFSRAAMHQNIARSKQMLASLLPGVPLSVLVSDHASGRRAGDHSDVFVGVTISAAIAGDSEFSGSESNPSSSVYVLQLPVGTQVIEALMHDAEHEIL